MTGDSSVEEELEEDYYAHFTIYHRMAYFLAKELHIRPGEILETWSAPELAVAYGEFANDIARKNLADWNALDAQTRNKLERPKKYNVKFYGVTEIE